MVRKKTAWNIHVEKVRGLHPEKSFKDILVLAAKSYKKSPVAKAVDTVMGSVHHSEKHHGKHKKHHSKHHSKHHKGGSNCMLPTADGSGSVTQADLVECGTAPEAAAPVMPDASNKVPSASQEGGKRKHKRKSRKARKSRKSRKSRKARKSRKSRKSRRRRR